MTINLQSVALHLFHTQFLSYETLFFSKSIRNIPTNINLNQLLQLFTARVVLYDAVVRPTRFRLYPFGSVLPRCDQTGKSRVIQRQTSYDSEVLTEVCNETAYDSAVLTKDTGVILSLPIDGNEKQRKNNKLN